MELCIAVYAIVVVFVIVFIVIQGQSKFRFFKYFHTTTRADDEGARPTTIW